MAATYNETLPTDRDWCRAQLGDTTVTPADEALHSDAHMDAVLLAFGTNRTLALGQLANELVTRFAQDPVKVALSGLSVDYSARIPAWQALSAPYLAWLARQATRAIGTSSALPPMMFGLARGGRG